MNINLSSIVSSETKKLSIHDFRGILTTNSGWREQIEKQIGEHEVILSDLECRQVRKTKAFLYLTGSKGGDNGQLIKFKRIQRKAIKSRKFEGIFKRYVNKI